MIHSDFFFFLIFWEATTFVAFVIYFCFVCIHVTILMWLLFMLLKFLIMRKILNITFRKYCNVSEVIGCLYTLCSNHNFIEDLFVKYNKMYQKLYVSKVFIYFADF